MRRGVLLVAALGLVLASCTGGHADRTTTRPTEVPPATVGPGAERTPEGLSWAADRALPTFARPRHLWVADVRRLPTDERVLFTTLQGLVNRQRPRIYLLQGKHDRGWLERLDVPWTTIPDAWAFLDRFGGEAKGSIVYDPAQPDSLNVATTLAGIEGAVVASPRLAVGLEAEYGLPIIEDLAGRFTDPVDAYAWQLEHLWPLTTHRVLVSIWPRIHREPTSLLRDYAIATRAMVVALDAGDADQRPMLERILEQVEPNTPFLGGFPGDEGIGVELLSEHAAPMLVADGFRNMTVFSGACCRTVESRESPPTPSLEDRIYVTFLISDGDNLGYDQDYLRDKWADPARGDVPIGWTISPMLVDVAPAILRYYRETASPNDVLVSAVSGAGYVYPTPWPDETFHLFTERTGDYMDRAGLDIVEVFDRSGDQVLPMSDADARRYVDDVDPSGILTLGHGGESMIDGTTPRAGMLTIGSLRQALDDIALWAEMQDPTEPAFLAVYVNVWMLWPAGIRKIANVLDPRFEVVRPDHFFELFAQAPPPKAAPVASVTASSDWEGNVPGLAVDGDVGSVWNSGDWPPGWIELDLGGPTPIEGVSLLTAQSPDADTVHRVLARASEDEPFWLLRRFAGFTTDGQWLHVDLQEPMCVRTLRVETPESPSWVAWREIRLEVADVAPAGC